MIALVVAVLGCGSGATAPAAPAVPVVDVAAERTAIGAVLDAFHDAAARADEDAYFALFAPGGVFLGTDATERWDVAAFRAYAHPHFARGRAWTFRATRRAIDVHGGGLVAWFDEDLATERLGPCRGSGVLAREPGGPWRIAQYNLAVTVPNERFDAVRDLLAAASAPAPAPAEPFLVGLWQITPDVGSGYDERHLFFADGRWQWRASDMRCSEGLVRREGTYRLEGETLELREDVAVREVRGRWRRGAEGCTREGGREEASRGAAPSERAVPLAACTDAELAPWIETHGDEVAARASARRIDGRCHYRVSRSE